MVKVLTKLRYHVKSGFRHGFKNVIFSKFFFGFIASLGVLISSHDKAGRIRDNLNARLNDQEDTFDFVIVGSGTAGSLMANRLSEQHKVLLLEAGGEPHPLQRIPGMAFFMVNHRETDWMHRTVPQRRACFSSPGRRAGWCQGRNLGGSGNLNYMVHMRGSPRDYDNWAKVTGDESWSYEALLHYFRRHENYQGDSPDREAHGFDGDMMLETPSYTGMAKEFIRAGQELGYEHVDLNARFEEGFDSIYSPMEQGERKASFGAFLQPVRERETLLIRKYSRVNKILIRSFDNTAFGVEYERHGVKKYAYATKEVIICAGAVESPKLLMLSGIGPQTHLADLGVPVIADLPVGKNLQDHLAVLLGPFFVDPPRSFLIDRDITLKTFYEYKSDGNGPLSSSIFQAAAMISSKRAKNSGVWNWPDILMLLSGMAGHKTFGRDMAHAFNLNQKLIKKYYHHAQGRDSFMIFVSAARPLGRGDITLEKRDAMTPPSINPHYLENADDMEVTIEGIKTALYLVENTTSFQNLRARFTNKKFPGCDHMPFRSDEYWQCYIRHFSVSLNDGAGTCAMGNPVVNEIGGGWGWRSERKDGAGLTGAVVDTKLQVIGINHLRVADASVMPTIVGSQTNAAVLMIAEKCADMINDAWSQNENGPPPTTYKPYGWSEQMTTPQAGYGNTPAPEQSYGPPPGPPPQQQYGPPPGGQPPSQQYGPPGGKSPPQQYGPPAGQPPPQQYGPPGQQTQYGPPQQETPPPQYGPPQQETPPPQQYGPPPQNQYGPPPQQYGPPAQPPPQYGPPAQPPQQYGPPQQPEGGYGTPDQTEQPPPESSYGPPDMTTMGEGGYTTSEQPQMEEMMPDMPIMDGVDESQQNSNTETVPPETTSMMTMPMSEMPSTSTSSEGPMTAQMQMDMNMGGYTDSAMETTTLSPNKAYGPPQGGYGWGGSPGGYSEGYRNFPNAQYGPPSTTSERPPGTNQFDNNNNSPPPYLVPPGLPGQDTSTMASTSTSTQMQGPYNPSLGNPIFGNPGLQDPRNLPPPGDSDPSSSTMSTGGSDPPEENAPAANAFDPVIDSATSESTTVVNTINGLDSISYSSFYKDNPRTKKPFSTTTDPSVSGPSGASRPNVDFLSHDTKLRPGVQISNPFPDIVYATSSQQDQTENNENFFQKYPLTSSVEFGNKIPQSPHLDKIFFRSPEASTRQPIVFGSMKKETSKKDGPHPGFNKSAVALSRASSDTPNFLPYYNDRNRRPDEGTVKPTILYKSHGFTNKIPSTANVPNIYYSVKDKVSKEGVVEEPTGGDKIPVMFAPSGPTAAAPLSKTSPISLKTSPSSPTAPSPTLGVGMGKPITTSTTGFGGSAASSNNYWTNASPKPVLLSGMEESHDNQINVKIGEKSESGNPSNYWTNASPKPLPLPRHIDNTIQVDNFGDKVSYNKSPGRIRALRRKPKTPEPEHDNDSSVSAETKEGKRRIVRIKSEMIWTTTQRPTNFLTTKYPVTEPPAIGKLKIRVKTKDSHRKEKIYKNDDDDSTDEDSGPVLSPYWSQMSTTTPKPGYGISGTSAPTTMVYMATTGAPITVSPRPLLNVQLWPTGEDKQRKNKDESGSMASMSSATNGKGNDDGYLSHPGFDSESSQSSWQTNSNPEGGGNDQEESSTFLFQSIANAMRGRRKRPHSNHYSHFNGGDSSESRPLASTGNSATKFMTQVPDFFVQDEEPEESNHGGRGFSGSVETTTAMSVIANGGYNRKKFTAGDALTNQHHQENQFGHHGIGHHPHDQFHPDNPHQFPNHGHGPHHQHSGGNEQNLHHGHNEHVQQHHGNHEQLQHHPGSHEHLQFPHHQGPGQDHRNEFAGRPLHGPESTFPSPQMHSSTQGLATPTPTAFERVPPPHDFDSGERNRFNIFQDNGPGPSAPPSPTSPAPPQHQQFDRPHDPRLHDGNRFPNDNFEGHQRPHQQHREHQDPRQQHIHQRFPDISVTPPGNDFTPQAFDESPLQFFRDATPLAPNRFNDNPTNKPLPQEPFGQGHQHNRHHPGGFPEQGHRSPTDAPSIPSFIENSGELHFNPNQFGGDFGNGPRQPQPSPSPSSPAPDSQQNYRPPSALANYDHTRPPQNHDSHHQSESAFGMGHSSPVGVAGGNSPPPHRGFDYRQPPHPQQSHRLPDVPPRLESIHLHEPSFEDLGQIPDIFGFRIPSSVQPPVFDAPVPPGSPTQAPPHPTFPDFTTPFDFSSPPTTALQQSIHDILTTGPGDIFQENGDPTPSSQSVGEPSPPDSLELPKYLGESGSKMYQDGVDPNKISLTYDDTGAAGFLDPPVIHNMDGKTKGKVDIEQISLTHDNQQQGHDNHENHHQQSSNHNDNHHNQPNHNRPENHNSHNANHHDNHQNPHHPENHNQHHQQQQNRHQHNQHNPPPQGPPHFQNDNLGPPQGPLQFQETRNTEDVTQTRDQILNSFGPQKDPEDFSQDSLQSTRPSPVHHRQPTRRPFGIRNKDRQKSPFDEFGDTLQNPFAELMLPQKKHKNQLHSFSPQQFNPDEFPPLDQIDQRAPPHQPHLVTPQPTVFGVTPFDQPDFTRFDISNQGPQFNQFNQHSTIAPPIDLGIGSGNKLPPPPGGKSGMKEYTIYSNPDEVDITMDHGQNGGREVQESLGGVGEDGIPNRFEHIRRRADNLQQRRRKRRRNQLKAIRSGGPAQIRRGGRAVRFRSTQNRRNGQTQGPNGARSRRRYYMLKKSSEVTDTPVNSTSEPQQISSELMSKRTMLSEENITQKPEGSDDDQMAAMSQEMFSSLMGFGGLDYGGGDREEQMTKMMEQFFNSSASPELEESGEDDFGDSDEPSGNSGKRGDTRSTGRSTSRKKFANEWTPLGYSVKSPNAANTTSLHSIESSPNISSYANFTDKFLPAQQSVMLPTEEPQVSLSTSLNDTRREAG